jgi:hypothetical protein
LFTPGSRADQGLLAPRAFTGASVIASSLGQGAENAVAGAGVSNQGLEEGEDALRQMASFADPTRRDG